MYLNKEMKKILRIVVIGMMIGVSTASEIRFFPDSWEIQKWCLVAVDIIVDTSDQSVAATDVVIESSLEYVDFVPNKNFFPNFFPPQVNDYKIHIIGFVSNSKELVSWSGSIGTLFLKQKSPTDRDGKLQLFFAGKWKTHDSNLSILWWIDILETVGKWLYTFTDTAECIYPIDYDIIGGFAHMSAQEWLNTTIKTLQKKETFKRIFTKKNTMLFSWLCLLLMIAFIYYKKQRAWKK